MAMLGRYREIFYGGAGGGGKSDALLMLAIQDDWVDDPDYSALILRKTFIDLNQPEGILNRAKEWLIDQPGVIWQAQHNRFVFNSGAVIQFGHCNGPNDHLKYRGGKYNLVCWDELTDFPEEQYTFLFSRQRRPQGSQLPLLTVSASNPGGTGHKWVRDRLVRNFAKKQDRFFIPANFQDNPYLDQQAYSETLDNLLPVERARIKFGDWDAQDTRNLFQETWFKTIDRIPEGPCVKVRSWDFAATPGGGDYTVGIKLVKVGDIVYVEGMRRGQWGPEDVDRIVRETAEIDGHDTNVVVEAEPGGSGKRANQYLRQQLIGYMFYQESPTGSKYIRALPAARMAAKNKIVLCKGPYIKQFMDEITDFTGREDMDEHDDIVDAFAHGINFLARRQGAVMG